MKKRSIVLWLAVLLLLLCLPAGAATSVDAVIEQTWSSIRGQIQNVVNNVVFPAVDMILAVVFFVKLPARTSTTASMDSLILQLPPSCSPPGVHPHRSAVYLESAGDISGGRHD